MNERQQNEQNRQGYLNSFLSKDIQQLNSIWVNTSTYQINSFQKQKQPTYIKQNCQFLRNSTIDRKLNYYKKNIQQNKLKNSPDSIQINKNTKIFTKKQNNIKILDFQCQNYLIEKQNQNNQIQQQKKIQVKPKDSIIDLISKQCQKDQTNNINKYDKTVYVSFKKIPYQSTQNYQKTMKQQKINKIQSQREQHYSRVISYQDKFNYYSHKLNQQQRESDQYSPSNYNFNLKQSTPLYNPYAFLSSFEQNLNNMNKQHTNKQNQSFKKTNKKIGSIFRQQKVNDSIKKDNQNITSNNSYKLINQLNQNQNNSIHQINFLNFQHQYQFQPQYEQDQKYLQQNKFEHSDKINNNQKHNSVYSTNKNTVYSTIQASHNKNNYQIQNQQNSQINLSYSRFSQQFKPIDADYQSDLFSFIHTQMINLNEQNYLLLNKKQQLQQLLLYNKTNNRQIYHKYKKKKIVENKNTQKIKYQKKQITIQLISLRQQLNFYKDISSNLQSSIANKMKKQQDFYFQEQSKIQNIKFQKQSKLNQLKNQLENLELNKITNFIKNNEQNKLSKIQNSSKKLNEKLFQKRQIQKNVLRRFLSIEPSVNYLQKKKEQQYSALKLQLQLVKKQISQFIK